MKTLLFAAAALLAPLPALAQTTPPPATAPVGAPLTIYGTELAPGWQNWSWAKTELSVELPGSARRPILVEAQSYQALYLHTTTFSTAPYRSFTFLVQSVGGEGQLFVKAIVAGKEVPGKVRVVRLAPGGWTRVEVALADLGAANTNIEGFWIQNGTGEASPRFYVTEIMLKP